MVSARDTHGVVYERGSALLLARVVAADGVPITAADVAGVSYTIYELSAKGAPPVPVAGHDGEALTPAETFFETLQTPPVWTVDATGYNFLHEVDVTSNEAFPIAGRSYQVRYEVQPFSGQKVVFRFQLKAI